MGVYVWSVVFFKQKTAYEMRISDWSSDVCSSDLVEITLIILPLVAPVLFSMGVDPLWFAILFALCLQTSFLTPPVGFALFYIKGVCPPGITTRDVYLGVLPYIIIQLIGLALVFYFAPLATWLPNEVYSP